MSTPDQAPYRPRHTGNPVLDEAFRKAFDYIYSLRSQVSSVEAAQSAQTTPSQVQAASQAKVASIIPASGTGAGTVGPPGPAGLNGTNGVGVPVGGATGQILAKNSATNYDTHWVNEALAGAIGITIDGGVSVPSTGSKGFVQVPYAGTITGWTLLSNLAGSAQITVKKCSYGAFPTTASIVASAPPSMTGSQKQTSSSLGTWTTGFSAGDIFEFNLDSVTTCTRLTLELQVTKS